MYNLKIVSQFNYLESIIRNDGDSLSDISKRIRMVKSAMTRLRKIRKDGGVSKAIKIRLVSSRIFSPYFSVEKKHGLICASKKNKEIDSFEMRCWRRIPVSTDGAQ